MKLLSYIRVWILIIVSWFMWHFYKRWTRDSNQRFMRDLGAANPYLARIRDWQQREMESTYSSQDNSGEVDLGVARVLHIDMLLNFKYVKDEVQFDRRDYWMTSQEARKRMRGDCEDFAILLMAKLRRGGFPDNKIGVVIVEGHAFCCVYHKPDDFMVLDNGYFTQSMVPASRLFPCKGKVPLYGFNFFEYWTYR